MKCINLSTEFERAFAVNCVNETHFIITGSAWRKKLMFVSTKPDSYNENRKAEIKNHNLPILQYMYMGSRDTPLACLISKTPAFINTQDFGNLGQTKRRFRIDFNHIIQRCTNLRQAGVSLDKGSYLPSSIFRNKRLDSGYVVDKKYLVEFMTIMPVCTEMHSYISQDSAKHYMTLNSFDKDMWPWVLQSSKNFTQFCNDFKLGNLNYTQFIDHLSDVHHAPLQERLRWDRNSGFYLT